MKRRLFSAWGLICVIGILLLGSQISGDTLLVKETRLAVLEPSTLEQKVTLFLPNGAQLRYRTASEYEVVMAILRVESEYEHAWYVIRPTANSPLGKRRSAYVTKHGEKYAVVLDGVSGKEYDEIPPYDLLFSPNGERFAFVARIGRKYTLVLDGKESPLLDSVTYGAFTTDSRHILCIGYNKNLKCVLFDGRPAALNSTNIIPGSPTQKWYLFGTNMPNSLGPDIVRDSESIVIAERAGKLTYTPIREGTSSPNVKRLAYTILPGDSSTLVLEGHKRLLRGYVAGLQFSPDSRRFAYTVFDSQKRIYRLLVDKRLIGIYKEILQSVFSPDSKHYACVVRDKDGVSVIVDGRRTYHTSGIYANVEAMTWSLNSKKLAYIDNGGSRNKVVLDGKAVFTADVVSAPTFSPVSRHIAYSGVIGDKAEVMLDGKIYDSWKNPRDVLLTPTGSIAFSQDGKHLAYTVDDHVVLDKKNDPLYDYVFDWTPYQYDYHVGARTVILEVASNESNQAQMKYSENRTLFDSPTKLSYLAIKNGWIHLVEQNTLGLK